MDVTYECRDTRLKVNTRHIIVARGEGGMIVGTYYGYWIPGLCSVTLYPDRTNPAWKPGFPNKRLKVYDGYVKCARPSTVPSAKSTADDQEAPKGETWRDRKKPMAGQEKMRF